MRCLACHYPLKGIRGPEHRCPECGRSFEPSNPRTFEVDGSLMATLLRRRANFVGCTLIGLLFLILATLLLLPLVAIQLTIPR